MSDLIPQRQEIVEFYGDDLTAIQMTDGRIFVSIRHLCDALGLNRGAQVRRIKRTHVLSEGFADSIRVLSGGGYQNIGMLLADLVPFWLSGIQIKSVAPELQEQLYRYQKEAARVLWEAFQEGRLTSDPEGIDFEHLLVKADPSVVNAYKMGQAIVRMARQQIILDSRVSQTEERLEEHSGRLEALEAKLSDDAHISDAQAAQLSQAVKAVAIVLGQQTKRNEFPGVYGELYRRYNCSSYKLLKKNDFENAINWLNEWKASLETDTF